MSDKRGELAAALTVAAQRSATDGVMLHQAVADKLGLHVTDLRCLNMLRLGGPATAGELAAQTALSTGAVTKMVDRLLAAGYVRRDHDVADRRRVIVSAIPARIDEIAPHYDLLAHRFAAALDDYSDAQLELVLDLFGRLHATSLEVAAALRAED